MKVFISQTDIEELYSQMPNPRVREILILANQRLVHFTVRKYFHVDKIDYGEMASRGNLGLIKAVDTYDITRNVKFSTFGIFCIRNELCRMFRDDVPKFETVSLEELICPERNNHLSLEDVLLVPDPEDDPAHIAECSDIMDRIYHAFNHLTDKERKCIVLWFGLDGCGRRSQVQIAKEIDISQPQVSRVCKRSIGKLRALVGIK